VRASWEKPWEFICNILPPAHPNCRCVTISDPSKINVKLTLDTDKLSETITKLARKLALTTDEALLNATRAFRNFGASMKDLGPIRFPMSVGYSLSAERRNREFAASGECMAFGAPRVEYAVPIHESIVSKAKAVTGRNAETIATELLKRYR
jgi:hypothetical protein